MRTLAIFGGSSSGLIVAASIARAAAAGEDVELIGFLNDLVPAGDRIGGYPVLGRFDDWRALAERVRLVTAFRLPDHAFERHARLRSLGVPEDRWETVRDPAALVDPSARIGPGCYLGPNAVIEHGAELGPHTIVRAGAYVSHDARVGEFGFVGPNASLLGRTVCGVGVHVGANAVCREGTVVGDYALIGVGAVVVGAVAAGARVAGNPARPLGPRRDPATGPNVSDVTAS